MIISNNFFAKLRRKYYAFFPKKILGKDISEKIKYEIDLVDKGNVFFGYHDRKPFNNSSELVLSHRSNGTGLDIGFFDLNSKKKEFIKVGSSNAFSSQQGAMLQWDYRFKNNTINYNILEKNVAKNISIDINSLEVVALIDKPIYCMNKNSRLGLSCNFYYLSKNRPGYGIENRDYNNVLNYSDDGIFLIDRDNEDIKLLASYEYLAEISKSSSKNLYINHLSFSPLDHYAIWFLIDENTSSRNIYFQGMSLGDHKKVFNIEINRKVSHFCWVGEHKIFAVNRDSSLQWYYSIYDLSTFQREDIFKSDFDGHPMFNSKTNRVLIDTTPDPKLFQHLLQFDMSSKNLYQLNKWKIDPKFKGPKRCDLHPRWNNDGRMISVDLIKNSKRYQKILFLGS